MVVESVFTERSVGRVEAGALVSQSCKHGFDPLLSYAKKFRN